MKMLIATAVLLLSTSAVSDHPPATTRTIQYEAICSETTVLEYNLTKNFGEQRFIAGMIGDDNFVLILFNKTTKSYSITINNPRAGMSCLLVTGKELQMLPIDINKEI